MPKTRCQICLKEFEISSICPYCGAEIDDFPNLKEIEWINIMELQNEIDVAIVSNFLKEAEIPVISDSFSDSMYRFTFGNMQGTIIKVPKHYQKEAAKIISELGYEIK